MAKGKGSLESAVAKQAANLDPAQREFVLAEFETYKWNAMKIAQVQEQVDAGDLEGKEEKRLLAQRHQLVSEQSALFSHIMRWLKGTAGEESEFDAFISGR